jgi:hypothetical protein
MIITVVPGSHAGYKGLLENFVLLCLLWIRNFDGLFHPTELKCPSTAGVLRVTLIKVCIIELYPFSCLDHTVVIFYNLINPTFATF